MFTTCSSPVATPHTQPHQNFKPSHLYHVSCSTAPLLPEEGGHIRNVTVTICYKNGRCMDEVTLGKMGAQYISSNRNGLVPVTHL